MADTYWLRQSPDKPLYPDLLWSRPENKRSRGKLLVVGGNLHSFAAVSQAYSLTLKAGIGTCRAILPDALAKTLGRVFPEAEYGPSNLSGSFAKSALSELLDAAGLADGVLLAGDFGKNSETAILLESFAEKYSGPLTVSGDSADYFLDNASLLKRARTIMALGFIQLQKMAASQGIAIKSTMDLARLVDALHEWTADTNVGLLSQHQGQLVAASSCQVSTTRTSATVKTAAAYAAVWQLQWPAKPFEALTTAVFDCPSPIS